MRLVKKTPQSVPNVQNGISPQTPSENGSQAISDSNKTISENFQKISNKILELEERIKRLENLRTLMVEKHGEAAVELHESISGDEGLKKDDIPVVPI